MEQKYLRMKAYMKEMLRKVPSVSLSVDSWTTANQIYMLGVTVHWVDARWEL